MRKSLPFVLPLVLALCCLAPTLALSGLGSAFAAWTAGLDATTSLWVVAATVAGVGLIAWTLGRTRRRMLVSRHFARLPLRRVLASLALMLILLALLVPLACLISM